MPATARFFSKAVLLGSVVVLCLAGGMNQSRPVAAADETSAEVARWLLDRTGMTRGLWALPDGDAQLALELAGRSELLIHVRCQSSERAAKLRARADEAGLGIERLVIDDGSLQRLPYADHLVDAVILDTARNKLLETLPAAEVVRVLRPEGTAIVGRLTGGTNSAPTAEQLRQWARGAAAKVQLEQHDKLGTVLVLTKPPLEGADDWSHWEKAPDNNPVSNDQVIRPPYMTQFMAGPLYIAMPSITTAAGGRTFLAIGHIAHHRREWNMMNKIIARNGYNGTILWERPLPEGYLVHRSAFVATKDIFYMIDGDHCLMLDAATGRERGRIRIPGITGHWKWMAMDGRVLYVLAGKPDPGVETVRGDRPFGGWSWQDLSRGYYARRIPHGFGDTLAAYDLDSQRRLWMHKETSPIDSRGMALRDNRLFLYCPDQHLRCLAVDTGQVLWTNADSQVLGLIEQPGRGLVSTPGWRTQTLVVATPEALIIQGQTRMNVVAVATDDGRLLWHKRKITNNPNAVYLNGDVILAIGRGGTHVVLDPLTGEEKANLPFRKAACTRLTACGQSLFCRGEGTLRFDLASRKLIIDGAQRPACNDGALPANGMLYLGPWQCDCNLSLIGCIAKCSADELPREVEATADERLEQAEGFDRVAPLAVDQRDWPTYRANNQRSASTPVKLIGAVRPLWQAAADRPYTPTAPVAAGGLVVLAGDDGRVRALDAATGQPKWQFATAGPITYPPTIWDGRALLGSGDGWVYCVEAATGRLLWRRRAAPAERQIMFYGHLASTWPVGSGVLVHDGVAYFGAGIIDQDGTYLYAVDARTGKLRWYNDRCGHLNPELRKGVSIQGNLAVHQDQLLLAGGNQISPARFELATGRCLAEPPAQGQPKANAGRFVGVLPDGKVILGGRILYSAPSNVSTKGSFVVQGSGRPVPLAFGGVPPAWNDQTMALVNFKYGKLTCCDMDVVTRRIEQGVARMTDAAPRQRRWLNAAAALEQQHAVRWQTDMNGATNFEVVSIAVCPNAIVAAVKYQMQIRARPLWFVVGLDPATGRPRFQQQLPGDPLPDGLLVDREGRVVVVMLDGSVLAFGPPA